MAAPSIPVGASTPIPPPVLNLPFGRVENGLVYLSLSGVEFLEKLWASIQGGGGVYDQIALSAPAPGITAAEIAALVEQSAQPLKVPPAPPAPATAVLLTPPNRSERQAIDDAMLLAMRPQPSAAVSGSYAAAGPVTASGLTESTATLLGRTSAGTGAVEEITVGSGLSLSAGSLTSTGSGGSVTSVDASGGTTGFSFTGGPITGAGTLTLSGTLVVADGGTGATTAGGARTNLGLVIGTNVQAWDADLDALAALSGTNTIYYRSAANTWSAVTIGSGLGFSGGSLAASGVLLAANNLSDVVSVSTARSNLGLDTAATHPATDFALSGAVTGSGLTQTTGRLLGRTSVSTGAIEEITVGSGLTLTGGALTASGGGSSAPAAPSIVQQATGRSAANASTSVTVTFGSNTTPGNCVAVLVSGYGNGGGGSGGVITVSGQTPTSISVRGANDGNQQMIVLVFVVPTAATAYTINIGSPNGGENVLALELSGLSHFDLRVFTLPTSGAAITCPVFGRRGVLNVLMIETDTNTGGLASSVSGLTTLYDAHAGSVNHAGVFFQAPDAAIGTVKTITMSSTAGTTIGGTAIFWG